MKNLKIMMVMIWALVFAYACDTDQPKRGLIDRPDETGQQQIDPEGPHYKDHYNTADPDWRAVRDYSYQQKDRALEEYRGALDALDKKIDQLEAQIEQKSDEVEHNTRQNWRETSENLKERRAQLAKNFQDLKNATQENWSQLQASFERNWEGLKDRWESAQAE